uniref:Retrovirus-related Pol polyprotein from transposon TNT 1-94-like beta-barrel domain-containing protein n=1 Tax=Cannabis sativa TaxID=3483 RepID=A0A803NYU4_CANSA
MEKSHKIGRRFEGKVAIVTASTQGIGFSIAERLGIEGASVVISSRKQKNVDDAVEKLRGKGIETFGIVCHVSNAQQRKNLIDKTVQKYGKIDVFISNAAVNPSVDSILETQESVLDKLWEVNVKASILVLQDAAPHMTKGSSVVFISSITAFRPDPAVAMYGVTKTALLGLTKASTCCSDGPKYSGKLCCSWFCTNTFCGFSYKRCCYRYVFGTTPQPPRSVEKTDENGAKVLTPQPPPSQSTNGDSSTKAALFASPETVADPAWYADSGATYHITTDFNNLTLQNDYHGSDKFMVANDELIPITHTGSTSLSSHHHLRTVNLHNVLCVPNIKKSLISISKLTVDNDVFVEFHVNNYLIKDETTS